MQTLLTQELEAQPSCSTQDSTKLLRIPKPVTLMPTWKPSSNLRSRKMYKQICKNKSKFWPIYLQNSKPKMMIVKVNSKYKEKIKFKAITQIKLQHLQVTSLQILCRKLTCIPLLLIQTFSPPSKSTILLLTLFTRSVSMRQTRKRFA